MSDLEIPKHVKVMHDTLLDVSRNIPSIEIDIKVTLVKHGPSWIIYWTPELRLYPELEMRFDENDTDTLSTFFLHQEGLIPTSQKSDDEKGKYPADVGSYVRRIFVEIYTQYSILDAKDGTVISIKKG